MDDGLVFQVDDDVGGRGNLGNANMGIAAVNMAVGMGMGVSMSMSNAQQRLTHQPQPQPHSQSLSPTLQPSDQPPAPHFPFQQQQQLLHHQQASDQHPRQLQTSVPMDQFGPSFFSVSDPYAGSPYASPAGGGPGFPAEYQYELGSEIGPGSGILLGSGSVSPFDGAAPLPLAQGPLSDVGHFWGTEQQHHQQEPAQEPARSLSAIDEFFIKNGAHRPPVPCNYCQRLRLQCLILQTTSANPNPISSCSSCVALYRDCSLAERGKREANAYETAVPVIGHLHGVCEEGDDTTGLDGTAQWRIGRETAPVAARSSSIVSYKRNSTRSVKKTRVLRNWFATHQEHPYPSEDEKSMLADQSGLSKTQVINWFANARRRHRLTAQSHFNNSSKVFLQGSPMPQTFLAGMSPMERWRHSPPNEEPVSASTIENAISTSQLDRGDAYAYPFDGNYATDGAPSSASSESAIFNQHPSGRYEGSSNSGSSAFSFYQSDDAAIFSLSAHSSIHGGDGDLMPGPSTSRPAMGAAAERGKAHMFQCTFCLQSFKKKYDWVRHERSIHLPGLDSWICKVPLPEDQSHLVWRVNHSEPECIFCGQTSPTDEHLQSHEFQSCAERPVSERTFTRKDHLWQHLHKFHRCRKWDGWKPNLHLLQHRQDKFESTCGFCQLKMHSWDERVQHLASHFRRGATMAEWTGSDTGISGSDGGRGMPSNRARVTPLSGDEADPSSLVLFS
ncbi:hypothetical protein TARUN_1845 [Trichoderma arundinaceum]|uniref:Homeobox and c2h2 transcription factor n=1 Tax=Trichoderma arundinaceum TaxID=490622 RepID=A0A395NW90_TRIAR|nr:hypothetical protein TARUN_1845 [Trichoderma arundinaceum]